MAEDKQEESSLAIRDQHGNEVFKIGPKGEVYWFDSTKGDLVKAEVAEDLGKAFALCIMQIAGMDYVRLIEAYLGESVKSFKTLLIKKIMEKSVKSKTIKKGDLVKIIDEFKI
jgi:hypothetical protein